MHNIRKQSLKNGIGLTCVTTDQSKTSCLSAMLALPLGAQSRSLSALLPFVLRSSCHSFPGRQAVAEQLDELYGARLEPIVRKRGEVQLIGFVADVIDERFAMSGTKSLFSGTAQLLSSLLLQPEEATEVVLLREIDQLCARIAALSDDKRSWAVRRMYQYMCADEAYGAVEFGDSAQLREITAQQLMEHYRQVISNAPLEVFYYGSLSSEQVAQELLQSMRDRPELPHTASLHFSTPKNVTHPLRHITEEEAVRQGKLTMGLRTGITAFDPEYPAMIVFNACFGGTTSSRLFRRVREQMSLCYYASSQTDKLKGVMAVSSGIENDSREQAEQAILQQLEEIQRGGLTVEEVNAAKRSVIASLRAIQDSPLALEGFYQTQAAAGLSETLDTLTDRVAHVTVEEVTQAARCAAPDTVYFLKGAAL